MAARRKDLQDRIVAVVVLGLIAFVAIGAAWVWLGSSTEPTEAGDDVLAYSACKVVQNSVRDRLRSPGSAEFSSCDNANVVKVSSTEYRVRGHVDSQNGFGALLRSEYVGVARHVGGDDWRVRIESLETR